MLLLQELVDCDLSFLDTDNGIDGFVDGLFHASVLFLRNEFEEPQVLHISDVMPLADIISMYIDSDMKTLQAIVPNGDKATQTNVPFLRIIMDHCHSKTPVNYKLEHLLKRIGVETVNARCNTAIVVGISSTNTLDDIVSLPAGFNYTDIDGIVRMASMTDSAPDITVAGELLPKDILSCMFLYMITPCAMAIKKDVKRLKLYACFH